jgi:hypothetical protein
MLSDIAQQRFFKLCEVFFTIKLQPFRLLYDTSKLRRRFKQAVINSIGLTEEPVFLVGNDPSSLGKPNWVLDGQPSERGLVAVCGRAILELDLRQS